MVDQSLIGLLETAKDPLEKIERQYPDGLTGNSAINFNAGIDKAIAIIRQQQADTDVGQVTQPTELSSTLNQEIKAAYEKRYFSEPLSEREWPAAAELFHFDEFAEGYEAALKSSEISVVDHDTVFRAVKKALDSTKSEHTNLSKTGVIMNAIQPYLKREAQSEIPYNADALDAANSAYWAHERSKINPYEVNVNDSIKTAVLAYEDVRYKQLAGIAKDLHYPDCWDITAYPTIFDALKEISHCSECRPVRESGTQDE